KARPEVSEQGADSFSLQETTIASPVILRVDPKGYYLYWTYQSKEMEFLDITSIRDTRFGKFAKMPKSQKLRDVFNMDFPDNNFLLKTLTVVSGPDMVDLTFHNFVSYKENVGKDWAEDVLALAKHPLTANASRSTFLDKSLVKLKMQLNPEGKIPVKNFFQMFPADRKRVEAALSACHLPKGKNDAINPEDFPESVYKSFLMNLCPRPEIDEIFTSYTSPEASTCRGVRTRELLTLHGPLRSWQLGCCPDNHPCPPGQLSPEGMVWFLCGPENSVLAQDKLLLHHDMTQPLNHYFINSSHNTYLTDIYFKEAIEAIAESAFKTSPYPVVLSFENHVDSPRQQAKMAEYCRTIFGDMLLTEPLEKFPLKPGIPLPSPEDLRGKILIKNKKKQFSGPAGPSQEPGGEAEGSGPPNVPVGEDTGESAWKEWGWPWRSIWNGREGLGLEGRASLVRGSPPPPVLMELYVAVWAGEEGAELEEEEVEEEEEESGSLDEEEMKKMQSDEGTAGLEKNRSYVISSFTELKAYDLLSKSSVQFVDYNKRQMSRIYPKGTRMDSSNYMPQMFWNADLPMQQNMALFEFNGQSGYLLKHEFMRRLDKQFNPFSVDRIDVVVISGQFLSERSVRTYVEVELFGLPGDPKRRYRTKLSPSTNSINPVWKEEPFVFEKILMPELASLRVAVMEDGNKFLGHRILPINALNSGYHHLCLHSESNMPLTMPALFVFLEMKDYVPDTWADLTVALANPIKFFSAHDKKSVKLKEAMGGLPENPFPLGGPVARQVNGASAPTSNGSADGAKAREEATKEAAGASVGEGRERRPDRPHTLRTAKGISSQMTKMMELARERQAAELKTLKETLETDTKEMKKKLEAKRLERIQAMMKVTTDKMAQERLKREINNSHIQEVVQVIKQEKLEEKQAACLEQIREMEKQVTGGPLPWPTAELAWLQGVKGPSSGELPVKRWVVFQQEALAEYEAKMKGLEVEVKESVRTCLRACLPSAEEDKPERTYRVSRGLCEQDALTEKTDAQESLL
ncbi:hypothetical protein E2I00_001162, partial [Balaenoptera physalus]